MKKLLNLYKELSTMCTNIISIQYVSANKFFLIFRAQFYIIKN